MGGWRRGGRKVVFKVIEGERVEGREWGEGGREGSSGLVGVSRQVSVIMIAREVGEEWDRRPCRSLGEGRARGLLGRTGTCHS